MIRKTALNPPDWRRVTALGTALLLTAAAVLTSTARAQEMDPAELEELVAPIALYPDDLLGIILPASTFPLEIVQAARFLDALESDPNLEPDQDWDDSVVALLNYPEVLRFLNEDLDWTWELGEAVLTDQPAVLAAAQDFRRRAYAAGNLRSDDKQIVSEAEGAIEIQPSDPSIVYVPVYEPREVIVYHSTPYYYDYYPFGYPVYYYPYPTGHWFRSGFFWGVTSYFSIGWHSHYLHVHHHSHRLHPYYLNSYYTYSPYYRRNGVNVTVSVNNVNNVWVASPRRGSRPRTVTVESRTSGARSATRTVTTERQPNISGSTRTTTTVGQQRAVTDTRRASSDNRASGGSRSSVRTSTARPDTSRSVQTTTPTRSQMRAVRPGTTASPQATTPSSSQRTRSVTPAPSTRSSAARAPATRSSAARAPATRSSAARAPATRPSAARAPATRSTTAPARAQSTPRPSTSARSASPPRAPSATRSSSSSAPSRSAPRTRQR